MCATSTSSLYLILSCFNINSNVDKLALLYFPLTYYILWNFGMDPSNLNWMPEILYIGVTSLAGAVVFKSVMMPNLLKLTNLKPLLLALNGLALFVAAAPVDSTLCYYLGNPFGNLLTPAFVGCDMAFAGLVWYVVVKEEEVSFEAKE